MANRKLKNNLRQALYVTLAGGETAVIPASSFIIVDEDMLSAHTADLQIAGTLAITDDDGEPIEPYNPGNPYTPENAAKRLASSVLVGSVVQQQDTMVCYLLVQLPQTSVDNWKVVSSPPPTIGDIPGLSAALAAKADLVSGKVPLSQLPGTVINSFLGAVSSEGQMLALSGDAGDYCVRTDTSKTFIITTGTGSSLGNWQELLSSDSAALALATTANGNATTAITAANNTLAGKFNTTPRVTGAVNGTPVSCVMNLSSTDLYSSRNVGGDVTFTASGVVYATKSVAIINTNSVAVNLTFPGSWKFLGSIPASLPAGKALVLSLTCFDIMDSTPENAILVAACALQN